MTSYAGVDETKGLAVELETVQNALESQSVTITQLAGQLGAIRAKAELSSTSAAFSSNAPVSFGFKDVEFAIRHDQVAPLPVKIKVPQLSDDLEADESVFTSQLEATIAAMDDFLEAEQSQPLCPETPVQSRAGLFQSSKTLRKMMEENLKGEHKDQAQKYYKTTGVIQAIARSHTFETVSLALVLASSCWIAVDLDYNHALFIHEADIGFQVVANVTCFLFTLELLIRLMAFERIRNMLKDFWSMFDLFLVVCMMTETWLLRILIEFFGLKVPMGNLRALVVLRIVRLVRIMRLVKLLHHLPELLVIVRGIAIALRAISLVFVLLGMIIYVGAIVFRVLLEDTSMGNELFGTVLQAMGTLLVDCALSGTKGGPLMRKAFEAHPVYSLLFFCFALLANVTVMGVLGALLVQTIKKITEAEDDAKRHIQNTTAIDKLWAHIVSLDENGDGFVTFEEFLGLLSDPKNLRLLKRMDVDPENIVLLADFVFREHNGRMSQKALKQWVLNLRGSQKSTMKDHYVTQKFLTEKLNEALIDMSKALIDMSKEDKLSS